MEEAAYDYFDKIDELGGMVEAVKLNFPQREIADAAYRFQAEVDSGERIVVGVNRWRDEAAGQTDILRIDPAPSASRSIASRAPGRGARGRRSSARSPSCGRLQQAIAT
jgi:methylmalonyl-CoA mutase N-terminal domain/subunit